MSMRTGGIAFLRQERQRHIEAIATIDAALGTIGAGRGRGGARRKPGPKPKPENDSRKRLAARGVTKPRPKLRRTAPSSNALAAAAE